MPWTWWLSVRHRPAAAMGVLALMTAASTVAFAGPALTRAAAQAGLRSELARATPGSTDVVVRMDDERGLDDQAAVDVRTAGGPAVGSLFGAPVVVWRSQSVLRWSTSSPDSRGRPPSRLRAASTGCRGYVVLSGHCPEQAGEVLVPRAGSASGARPGDRLRVSGLRTRFLVAGTYDAARSRPAQVDAGVATLTPEGPALVVRRTDLTRSHVAEQVSARLALRRGALGIDEEPRARALLERVRAAALDQGTGLTVDSLLPAVLDAADDQTRTAAVLAIGTAVPTALACWAALLVVMQLVSAGRAREWALARLRGASRPSWLATVFAEPVALVLLGCVLGTALGWWLTRVFVALALDGGGAVAVEPARPVLVLAVVGTLLSALVGLVLASLRAARMPLAVLVNESSRPPRATRAAVAAYAALVTVTVVAAVALSTTRRLEGTASGLALVLPGLLALTTSALAGELVVRLSRRRLDVPPTSPAALVVGRQLGRVPHALSSAQVVAAAVATAVFASQVGAVAARNEQQRATTTNGASTVLHVDAPRRGTLLDAVRRADPSGRFAMAVEERDAAGDGATSRVVAVDASRLRQVSGSTLPGLTDRRIAELAAALAPAHAPGVRLSGRRLRLSYDDATTTVAPDGPDPAAPPPRPLVVATLLLGQRWVSTPLGTLRPGRGILRAAVPCATGCGLLRLGLVNLSSTPYTATLRLTSLSTERQGSDRLRPLLKQPGQWQSVTGAGEGEPVLATATARTDGLHVAARDLVGQSAAVLAVADGPDPLPAVLAGSTSADRFPGRRRVVVGTGLDGQAQLLRVVGRVRALPRSLTDGVLVDLRSARRLSDPATDRAEEEVWLARGTPPRVLGALADAGVRVRSVDTTVEVRQRIDRTAPARTAVAGEVLAALLLLVVLVVVLAAATVDGRRRRTELRVLVDGGLTTRRAGVLMIGQLALPALAAVVVGAGAAIGCLFLVGDRLPLFADAVGPELVASPDVGALVTLVAVALLVVLTVSVLVTAGQAGRLAPGRR